MMGLEKIDQKIRDSGTLLERLEDARCRIGKMCRERRGPHMTIPVRWDDDDVFISTTLKDAIDALGAPDENSQ